MEELLKELEIFDFGTIIDDKFIMNLENSNQYQFMFDELSDVENLTLDEDSVEFNLDVNKATFYNDDVEITLVADFNKDKYQLIATRR